MLDLIFTVREPRRVSHSLTVQYDKVLYLRTDTPGSRHLIGKYIEVYEYPDGRIEPRADGAALPYIAYNALPAATWSFYYGRTCPAKANNWSANDMPSQPAMLNWPLRIMCMSSMRAKTDCAARKSLNPAAGLVVHSDRGSQYASAQYQALLTSHGLTCSISRKGNCWTTLLLNASSWILK